MFLNMTDECFKQPYWLEIIDRIDKKYSLYLQLIYYLETEDKSETSSLQLLNKMFELVHSEVCANDLIRRI
jgi:hypothetical protein